MPPHGAESGLAVEGGRTSRPSSESSCPDVSVRNAAKMLEVVQALGPRADGDRVAVRAAIANQAEHFDMLGLQLGFHYEAGAIAPDGSARPAAANPVREFVPCGRPGARVPHAWALREGVRVSTLDLLSPDRFTLITAPAGAAWIEAAATIASPPLRCVAIGRDVADPDGAWTALLGIEKDGALLVRPDQHVAWRSVRGAGNPSDALRSACSRCVGI